MQKSTFLPIAILLIGAISNFSERALGQDVSSATGSAVSFEQTIRPLLIQYCSECHSSEETADGFLAAKNHAEFVRLRESYTSAWEHLAQRTMPPVDAPQIPEPEWKVLTEWLQANLPASARDRISQYVVAAYEDKDNNLWFGTIHDGAARFDGKSLTYFSTKDGLPSNVVVQFTEDNHGNLWLGTHEGICRFDGQNFQKFGAKQGLPGTSTGIQADRAGNIWASSSHGVFRFDGTNFSEFKVPMVQQDITSYGITAGRVSMELEDSSGKLWFSTDGYGVICYDGKVFKRFTKQDGLCSNNITSILQDSRGDMWFTCMQSYQPKMTGDGGLCRFDGTTFTRFPDIKGLSENDIYTIYEDSADNLWIGATGVGAYRYDGRSFTLFDETDRNYWTRNFGVQGIVEDKHGTLWFGFSGGLFRFNGAGFVNVAKVSPWRSFASSQPQEEPILHAPEQWGIERLQFPLSFAPSLKYQGIEDIRFAPGWSQPESPDYWTYKFAWKLDQNIELNEESLAEILETYFDGLSRTVAQRDDLSKPTAVFIVDGKTYRGRLRIYDAFSTNQWIYLNVKVESKTLESGPVIVFSLSPKYFDHAIWKNLDEVQVK